jgi:hypothetical protein
MYWKPKKAWVYRCFSSLLSILKYNSCIPLEHAIIKILTEVESKYFTFSYSNFQPAEKNLKLVLKIRHIFSKPDL